MPVTRFPNGVSGASSTSSDPVDYTITWTANEPTAGDSATIADGSTPTVAETGQAIQDITTKLNAVLAVLRANGLVE